MKISTKTGDAGQTSLYGGRRIEKDDPRVEAYGTVDELNAHLGAVRASSLPAEASGFLETVQRLLFDLGADLATPHSSGKETVRRIGRDDITVLEREIDRLENVLPPLSAFILPGGSPVGAQLHVARAVCRRAERLVVRFVRLESLDPSPLIFLNRLSDLLFLLSRDVNRRADSPETPWHA